MAVSPTSIRHDAARRSEETPEAGRPLRRSWGVSLLTLCAVLGGLLGLSVKTESIRRQKADASNAQILEKQIVDQQHTIASLEQNRSKYENSIATETRQTQVLADDLRQTRIQAGLTAVSGPGLRVILTDSKKSHPFGTAPSAIMPDIIHDTDIYQLVNELKASGAEAISINGQRLVAMSSVRCVGPTVYVNNTNQASPFVIQAIGDPNALEGGLNIPGGIVEQLRGFNAGIRIEKADKLTLPAFAGAIQPRYAVAVPSPKAKG